MFVLHVKGMASACSIVLCLSVRVLCHHQVLGFFFLSLPRIRSHRKVLVSVSDGKCQPSRSGEVSGVRVPDSVLPWVTFAGVGCVCGWRFPKMLSEVLVF